MEKTCGHINKHQMIGRIGIATVMVVVATHGHWYLLLPALYIFWTVYAKRCGLFRLLGINSRGYELSYMPDHNPYPTLVFDQTGELTFSNRAAEISRINSLTFDEIDPSERMDPESIILQERIVKKKITHENRIYMLTVVGIRSLALIFVYSADITGIERLSRIITETQREIIYTVGEIGEQRSRETGNHVKRVAEYSRLLALFCGMDSDEAELLKTVSPMHDVGKIAIPDAILKKPGPLTANEFSIMKTHAELGEKMLGNSRGKMMAAAAIVAGQHHEKWDGSGYPRGRCGEDIHLYGRITAVADVFDALGSKRVYKDAWPLEKILDLFRRERGAHFDPSLTDYLLDNIDQFLHIRDQYRDIV
ncbi:MAG: HD-GYP domain-containing protein [Fibrobacterota bacterium]